MPEFQLRYKPGADDEETALLREQANKMAEAARKAAKKIFGWEVVYEVRPFSDNVGQPDFAITGWVTDNDDTLVEKALEVQAAVLEKMQDNAYPDQTVECWWQRVKGKWHYGKGKLKRAT